jgi:hypothetical protein
MTKTPNGKEAQGGYSGKIPTAAVIAFEQELFGLIYGTANLVIHIRDGKFVRFTTSRERSHMVEEDDGK